MTRVTSQYGSNSLNHTGLRLANAAGQAKNDINNVKHCPAGAADALGNLLYTHGRTTSIPSITQFDPHLPGSSGQAHVYRFRDKSLARIGDMRPPT